MELFPGIFTAEPLLCLQNYVGTEMRSVASKPSAQGRALQVLASLGPATLFAWFRGYRSGTCTNNRLDMVILL
ncbi:hypothetical protein TWF694_009925 [Orbilia ellipsospora]|uniref:Uncharacterized protein n=1 Tax=Orbilia ellipsospora TaxID=2528407 RepID=A0AAV9XCA9_9PEZI